MCQSWQKIQNCLPTAFVLVGSLLFLCLHSTLVDTQAVGWDSVVSCCIAVSVSCDVAVLESSVAEWADCSAGVVVVDCIAAVVVVVDCVAAEVVDYRVEGLDRMLGVVDCLEMAD